MGYNNISHKFGTFCFYIILKLIIRYPGQRLGFGTFCFYIILKLSSASQTHHLCLVPSAFTSFSNIIFVVFIICIVWYLLLLHHSQTSHSASLSYRPVWYLLLLHHSQTLWKAVTVLAPFGTFCFYIILKRSSHTLQETLLFGTFCFYIILKRIPRIQFWEEGLVPSAFTSFSNHFRVNKSLPVRFGTFCFYIILKLKGIQTACKIKVWYLLLLHHSQTDFRALLIRL